jgi:hypothetical protein
MSQKGEFMSNGWLERSLSALEAQAESWPSWKRDAASTEPQFVIPAPQAASSQISSPETKTHSARIGRLSKDNRAP